MVHAGKLGFNQKFLEIYRIFGQILSRALEFAGARALPRAAVGLRPGGPALSRPCGGVGVAAFWARAFTQGTQLVALV